MQGIGGLDKRSNRPPQHLHYLLTTHTAEFIDEFPSLLDEVISMPGSFYICGDFNCQRLVSGQVDQHLTQVLDYYDLLQHVNVPTHIDEGILNLIITLPTNPLLTNIHVEDMRFLDHFVIISTSALARPDPVCQTCDTRKFMALDLNAFRSKLRQLAVFTAPCTDMNGFADQLRDCISGILDVLVQHRRMTKRCGKPSNK